VGVSAHDQAEGIYRKHRDGQMQAPNRSRKYKALHDVKRKEGRRAYSPRGDISGTPKKGPTNKSPQTVSLLEVGSLSKKVGGTWKEGKICDSDSWQLRQEKIGKRERYHG